MQLQLIKNQQQFKNLLREMGRPNMDRWPRPPKYRKFIKKWARKIVNEDLPFPKKLPKTLNRRVRKQYNQYNWRFDLQDPLNTYAAAKALEPEILKMVEEEAIAKALYEQIKEK
jgi:hypothetical protein